MLTLQNMPGGDDRFKSDVWAYGLKEMAAFDALPDPDLKELLALHADDPAFLNGYIIPVLRSNDPYGRFMADLGASSLIAKINAQKAARAQAAAVAAAARAQAAAAAAAAAQEKNKSQWWYTAPWYPIWDPTKTRVPFQPHDIKMYNWLLKATRINGRSFFPEPPKDAPDWGIWVQIMIQNYGINEVPPPPKDSPLYPIWHANANRGTHPGGTLGRAFVEAKAVVSKFGKLFIQLVGLALSPFTGGASLLASQLIVQADNARIAASRARSAKKVAAADAAALQTQSDAANAATMKQVDDFFNSNQAWFAQQGITPDSWSKMTLDQKIAVIRAGATGTPVAQPQDPTVTTAIPSTPGPVQTSASAAPAPATAWSTPSTTASDAAAPSGGGGGAAPYGYQDAQQQEAATQAAPAPAGQYDIFIEGAKVGTFNTLPDATKAVLEGSKRGDRLEIVFNGKSLGLRLRTSNGSIDVPDDIEAAVRTMDRTKIESIVTEAEKSLGTGGTSILPWILAAGAAVALA